VELVRPVAPPWAKWGVIALISLGTILNYLSRNALGVLAPVLKTQFHFSTAQYSYVVGAFQLAYTLMQPVCGLVIDLLGLRLGYALFAALWSAASMMHGTAGGWLSLAGWRAALGFSEAAAIPAGVKAVGEWFPAEQRSVGVGWFNAGTSLGALLAPPVVIGLSLAFGWRAAFVATGGAGFLWAGLWWLLYRSPEGTPAPTINRMAFREMGVMARSPAFWSIAVPRFLAEPTWQTFSFWVPLYLFQIRHMDLRSIALFAWLPFLAADLGGVLGGYLSPWLMRRFGVGLIRSRVTGVVLGAVLMIGPGCIGLASDAYWAIALFCIGGFAHQMISGLINTLTVDVFPAETRAGANGLVGMAGWTGGLLFSLAVGALSDTLGFGWLFACLAVFDIVGAIVLIAASSGRRPVLQAIA
jgi:ACS family hexuronate transporter-like MFS transporter